MKKKYILHSLICLLAVSCTVQESEIQTSPLTQNRTDNDVFYADLESSDTKVSVDESIKLSWDADDRISIFNRNTRNQSYQFSGETGDKAGTFTRVSDPVEAENNLGAVYAVYPYQESTSIRDAGVITLTLPSEQTYREGSFGPGANMMVSTTDDNLLTFKNLCGYLVLKFSGSGSIKSIKLEGNNNEPLSGEATVTPVMGTAPALSMASTAGTSITLNCETPVELGSTPSVFWMVVPPTRFTQGFTLTVTDPNGYIFFKETTRTDLSIDRNSVLRIASIAVSLDTSGISLNDDDDDDVDNDFISPVNPENQTINYKTSVDEERRTITVTMPTVTNFKNLVFNFNVNGKTIYADGKKIVSGETPIDASKDVILTIRDGQYGKNYTLKARNTGLPVVRITTTVPQSTIEADTDHETWYSGATIRVEKADGKIDLDTAPMQIKGRGNASWTYNKRPFALKLDQKAKVLGMKKHKRWILLANWKDRTLLRNDAAFWLSKKSGLPYTVSGYFVELEFNGVHRGNYYLCEQIKIDENRVNITKIKDEEEGSEDPYLITGPYIMEIDNNYDETYKFKSGFYGNSNNPTGLKYMFHEPDENLPNAAVNYMKNYIQNMESLIKKIPSGNYGYRSFLDMDSAIWFMFVNELTGNGDFFNTDGSEGSTYYGPHSTFLYKDRDKEDGTVSKLFMGPVWDFDYKTFISKLVTTSTNWHGTTTTEDNRSQKWVGATNQNYYYYYLCKDPVFKARMLNLWDAYKEIITPDAFNEYIDSMADYLRLSEIFNTRMWGVKNGKDQKQNGDHEESFQGAVNLMKTAFEEKRQFMNNNLGTLNQ